jgi:CheY-like chemotaxis protein/HPt (histidine-containing phosphotransfer) domain-containing protein
MADDRDENEERVPDRPRTARILLVGAIEVHQQIADALTAAGRRADLARDGVEAENAIRSQAYDLVLMDVQTPGTDAVAATKRIRALQAPARDIPIIAMTPDGPSDDVVAFHAAGMNDHIRKPFDASRLAAMIDAWLPDLPRDEPSGCTLDPQVHDELVAILGTEKIGILLSKFEAQLARSFATAPQAVDPPELAREAHSLVSQAGMLGFLELADACRDLEAACLSGEDAAPFLASARSARDRAVREIGRLRHGPRQSAA